MDKIKWGILGTAGIARKATIPGMKKACNCELYAIAGRSQVKVDDYVNTFGFAVGYADDDVMTGYERLLNDPQVQAVYIPLPNNLHKEWVIKALDAGKHVLCEKPLALNADDAAKMYEAAKRNNVTLMEAYAYLHSPYIDALVADVASGVIGDVVYVDTAFVTQGYRENFRLHKELGGGMIYDLGCYCTTLILSLIDSSTEYVKACGELTDEGVDSFVGALIKFSNGARASFNVGMILGIDSHARYDRLFIHGTKGDIRSEVEYNEEGELSYRIIGPNGVKTRNVVAKSNYALEIEQMGRVIMGQERPRISEDFSVKNARLLDALLKEVGY